MFIKQLILAAFFVFQANFALTAWAGDQGMPSSVRSQRVIERVTPSLQKELAVKGMKIGDPVFMRIIKATSLRQSGLSDGWLELYLAAENGRYTLFKTYSVCAASGEQGPKTRTGDNQSPEGFYYLTPGRLNPWSSYHLSLNLGYPNTYDRAHGRTGDYLMIHGNCVSIGCYAMTDQGIEEIYTLVQAAMKTGQRVVRVHSFPFPMTEENTEEAQGHTHEVFWNNLKEGWDWFETHQSPPDVTVKGQALCLCCLTLNGSALALVIHIEFNRVRMHGKPVNLFHFQFDIGVDLIIIKYVAGLEEIPVAIQIFKRFT